MPTPNTLESPERDLTDASLREEREKADREMTASRLAVERDADAVVEHARENADAVMVAAREKADEKASEKTAVTPGARRNRSILADRTRPFRRRAGNPRRFPWHGLP